MGNPNLGAIITIHIEGLIIPGENLFLVVKKKKKRKKEKQQPFLHAMPGRIFPYVMLALNEEETLETDPIHPFCPVPCHSRKCIEQT